MVIPLRLRRIPGDLNRIDVAQLKLYSPAGLREIRQDLTAGVAIPRIVPGIFRRSPGGLPMTVVVVGNPKPNSRTRAAAELVARRLTGQEPSAVIEVVELGPGLLGWGDPKVAEAKATVLSADSLVVASPTFKATYTGLLKLFLDQFGQGELDGIPTFPLMLGGAYNHALAPELTLRPVLVEIGASCPAPSLYLIDSEYETSPDLDAWLRVARKFVPAVAQ
jgi:FMN reductase